MSDRHRGKGLSDYTAFLIFNAVFFMMDTVSSYFNIYLDQLGFTKTMIGTVTGVASLAAMLFQPAAGMLMDRSASRTRIMQLLILMTAVLYPLLLANNAFLYVLAVYTVYFISNRLQHTVNTALSVQFAEESGRDYGPIRMMGAVGYTCMMWVVSFVAGTENGVVKTFWVYSALCVGTILLMFPLPPMPGRNQGRGGSRVSPFSLLKDRNVVRLICFHTLIATANSIGQTYFPIYVASDMGAGNSLYGAMVAVGAMLEIPFLFLTDRIIRRLGLRKTILALGLLVALRWGNAYFAAGAFQLFLTQGMNFVIIVEGVAIAILINRQVRPEVKTVAQTLVATIQGLAGILVSSFLGGILADSFGIRPLFLLSAGIALATAFLFWFLPPKESGQ